MVRAILKVLSSTMATKLALAVVGIALIRFMEATEFATLTFGVGIATVASQVIGSTVNRLYIAGHERMGLTVSSTAPLLFQTALILVFAALLPFVGGGDGHLFLPIFVLVIGNTYARYIQTWFQQQQRFDDFARVELVRAGLVLVSMVALIAWAREDTRAGHVMIVQGGVRALVFVAFVFQRRPFDPRPAFGAARRVVIAVFGSQYRYLFGYFLVFSVFAQVEIFVLSDRADDVALATFGAGFRYGSLLTLALSSVKTVLFPMIRSLRTREEVEGVFKRFYRLAWVVVPGLALAAVAAEWVLPWIDGGRYPESITVFQILCASALVSFALSPHSEVVQVGEAFRFLFMSMSAALFLKVGLSIVLVDSHGAIGAALATMIATGVANVAIWSKARRIVRRMGDASAIAARQGAERSPR